MKLQEIRRNAELVSSIRKLSEEPAFRVLMEMLEDEHVRNWGDLGAGVPEYDDAKLWNRSQGYERALKNIKEAGIFIQPTKEIKPEYPE